MLSADKALFHEEKDAILVAGLQVSRAITVDDSGARHQGKNGYVLHIGNELFGWFGSTGGTGSKSRINFLEQLHAGAIRAQVNEEALGYMQAQGLSAAGQFAMGLHALCWIHAKRRIHKLIPINDAQRQAVALVRGQLWGFYADLKACKRQPEPDKVAPLQARFDALFTQSTDYCTLDGLLRRLHRRKSGLLLVLRRPDMPLHANGSETDIRDFVKKRKVSGGTRSGLGRQCRDTFASLKKTCRKPGASFWLYLLDRVSMTNAIPPLSTLIRNAAIAGALP